MPDSGDSRPWFSAEAAGETRKHAPATLRNREAIVDVLRAIMPESGLVLEIASGSGEHIVHFAQAFPGLAWQPSDPDPACRASIAAWIADTAPGNVRDPLDLDASAADWPITTADAILCINMIHISPWRATRGLLEGAARLLPPGGPLYIYGPFVRPGFETAPSNEAFDCSLRARNREWGLRNLDELTAEADNRGLIFERLIEMPANNLSLVFRIGGGAYKQELTKF